MPGTEFSAKEVATSTGHGSNQRPSASRERILQLCDRSVPLLESRRTEGERRYTGGKDREGKVQAPSKYLY